MTEELVTLETAKLLKEKGFLQRKYFINVSTLHNCYKYLSVPPQSVVQRWLRETKDLHIEISYMYENYWIYDILALEAGIQEALKLI